MRKASGEKTTTVEPKIRMGPGFEERWPGADAAATELAINLFWLNDRVRAFSEAFVKAYGVPSPAAFNVLTILHGAPDPLPPSVIADRSMVSRPTMTGVVRSLVDRGLVELRDHPEDRRMALVAITPEGRRKVEAMRPELHRREREWIGCLTRAEQAQLRGLVAKLQANHPKM